MLKKFIGGNMTRDPFDKIEEEMKEMMDGEMSGGGRSVSIRKTPEGTTVDVSGDVPDEEIDRLKDQYPDAEIRVDGESIEEEQQEPIIEVVDEDNKEESE